MYWIVFHNPTSHVTMNLTKLQMINEAYAWKSYQTQNQRFFRQSKIEKYFFSPQFVHFLNPLPPTVLLPPSLSLLVTTSLFLISMSLFLFCYIHLFVLFFRFHIQVTTYSICLSLSYLFHST